MKPGTPGFRVEWKVKPRTPGFQGGMEGETRNSGDPGFRGGMEGETQNSGDPGFWGGKLGHAHKQSNTNDQKHEKTSNLEKHKERKLIHQPSESKNQTDAKKESSGVRRFATWS